MNSSVVRRMYSEFRLYSLGKKRIVIQIALACNVLVQLSHSPAKSRSSPGCRPMQSSCPCSVLCSLISWVWLQRVSVSPLIGRRLVPHSWIFLISSLLSSNSSHWQFIPSWSSGLAMSSSRLLVLVRTGKKEQWEQTCSWAKNVQKPLQIVKQQSKATKKS